MTDLNLRKRQDASRKNLKRKMENRKSICFINKGEKYTDVTQIQY